VVVNNGVGGVDDTQEAVDDSLQGSATNYAYATQSMMDALYPAGADGLPDAGFFPANDFHPDVQLAFRNNRNGHNARRILANGESYTFSTGSEHLSDFHVFMEVKHEENPVRAAVHFASFLIGLVLMLVIRQVFHHGD